MYYLYVLKSLKDLGYYVGSAENVENRLKEHNKRKTKSIKHRIPFKVVYTETYNTRRETIKRENQLKKNYKMRKELMEKLDFKNK